MRMMRHVDLCSGIGGFSLGFEWAGLSRPVMFCDVEPWCRKVLAKHWPDVPIAEDVKELANDPEGTIPECDIITAGYPCQPFSLAGERKGTEDDRHIWPYIREIVARKRPAWCVFENVYGHVSMGLDTVLADLEADGYTTRPFIVPACSVDAPHRRDRVWIVGYSEDIGRDGRAAQAGREGQAHQPDQSRPKVWGELGGPSADVADTSGRRHGYTQEEVFAGWHGSINASIPSGDNVADTDSERGCSWNTSREDAGYAGKSSRGEGNYPGRVETWKPEPPVGRVAHGIPRRVDRLKGLGNAIVPQVAMQIGVAIRQCEADAIRQFKAKE